MALAPLGVALRFCRDRRQLSLREAGQLSGIDHAYIHRIETGEKESPSSDIVNRLLKVLKPTSREAEMVNYLVDHPNGDPSLVRYVLEDSTVTVEEFELAYGVRNRGTVRQEPAVLIERARRVIGLDDG